MNDKTPDKKMPKKSPKVVRHKAPAAEKHATNKDHSTTDKKPEFNSVVHAKTPKKKNSKMGISHPSAVLLALLATLTGGAIGWIGPAIFKGADPTLDLQASIRQLQTQITEQDADMDTLQAALAKSNVNATAQRTQFQTSLKALQDSANDTVPVDAEALQELFGPAIEELETGFAALKPQIDALNADVNTRIDLLETSLTEEGAELSEGTTSQALLERFTKLEAAQTEITKMGGAGLSEQFTNLQTQIDQLASEMALAPAFPEPAAEEIIVPDVENAYDSTAALQILVNSFPRAKMLEAVHAQDVIANKKPSWLQRTLSKHVKVRDDNAPTALVTIDAAQAAIKNGDIAEAIVQIGKLNPPVRAIAADWVSAAKKTAKSIETNTMNKGQ